MLARTLNLLTWLTVKEFGAPLPARSPCMDMVMSGAASPSRAVARSTSVTSSAAAGRCSGGIAMEQPAPPQWRFARTFATVICGGGGRAGLARGSGVDDRGRRWLRGDRRRVTVHVFVGRVYSRL